jgi:hypothetical protein
MTPTGGVTMPRKLQEADHPSALTTGWHRGTIYKDSEGTYEEGRFNAPEKSGMRDYPLSCCPIEHQLMISQVRWPPA